MTIYRKLINPLNQSAQGGSRQEGIRRPLTQRNTSFSSESNIRTQTFAIGRANNSAIQQTGTGALPVINLTKLQGPPPKDLKQRISPPSVLPKIPLVAKRLSLQNIPLPPRTLDPLPQKKGSSTPSKIMAPSPPSTEKPEQFSPLYRRDFGVVPQQAQETPKKTLSNTLILAFPPVDFIKELAASELNRNWVKLKSNPDEQGGNSIVKLHHRFALKSGDPDTMRTECILDKYLDSCFVKMPQSHMKVPQSHMLDAGQFAVLKNYLQCYDIAGKDVMLMARVKGSTFRSIITDEDPKFKKQFNKNIIKRMQEIGRLAAFDMLIGNSDRLVSLQKEFNGLKSFPDKATLFL